MSIKLILSKLLSVFRRHGLDNVASQVVRPMLLPCGVSRSGTTLLSAVLDAHSKVCMGYEMLFPALPGVNYIIDQLENVRSESVDLRRAGSLLRKQGLTDLGKWISRCYRLGLGVDDLLSVLEEYRDEHGDSLDQHGDRLLLIQRVLSVPEVCGDATYVGFKVTDDAFEAYLKYFPESLFVYILRDPRDVYASLKNANFGVSLDAACARWVKGVKSFTKFQKQHPEQCRLVRYEDIVADPALALAPVFEMAGLEMEDDVLEFHQSKARILDSSHPNASNLKKGFFGSSAGRYIRDLSTDDAMEISRLCNDDMRSNGYLVQDGTRFNAVDPGLYTIPHAEFERKMVALNRKAKLNTDDYAALLTPYLEDDYEVMPLLDFTRVDDVGDRKILVIRHDIDHNHITAMKMAKWEYDHGIRSTYCMLHTTWYYGKLEDGVMRHTTNLVECAKYLHGLGHEIALHNNLAVTALKEGIDPIRLLGEELEFFKGIGIQIKGSATHGDALCHDLTFRNYELFKESCDGRYGGPRSLVNELDGERFTVTLGEIPMVDFGLEYEAYEIFWDVYHTDSGGNPQTKTNRHGMRQFGRTDQNRGSLVGVLAHPVWWDFS